MPKTTLGKLPREAIRLLELPRIAPEILDGLHNLVDLTGTISDACDELGIVAVIPGYVLPPVTAGKRIVGPALTVRNIAHATQIHKAAQDKASGQGETEAHNLAEPGDVLESGCNEIQVDAEIGRQAFSCIERMLAFAAQQKTNVRPSGDLAQEQKLFAGIGPA